MHTINAFKDLEIDKIPIEEKWNFGKVKEKKMHKIHAYPAKFPSFIADLAIKYATTEGVELNKIADIFCGCGTVALESKRNNIDFWGCDINPVATLIAKVKSENYYENYLSKYYNQILDETANIEIKSELYSNANPRIRYWFTENSYIELHKIKQSILRKVPKGKYRNAFLCIFSEILKASSRWLTKSIKPQVDPDKEETDVFKAFDKQYKKFVTSVIDLSTESSSTVTIKNTNFLTYNNTPSVDMIISSPPYVTSYEYADLHQLSSLWLGYVEDYKELRNGSIGSIYNCSNFDFENIDLNLTGRKIIDELLVKDIPKSKIKSVARYFSDMQQTVMKCFNMLNTSGMIFFVIGDTEYKGVRIENSVHLIETLKDNGFSDIKISRRKISNKLLTSYRDANGKFSSDKNSRKIYHEEYVISGRK